MFSKVEIEQYFTAEKNGSILLMIIGAAALIGGIALLLAKPLAIKGAATPLLALGLLLGIAGNQVYRQCDAYRQRNVYAFDMNPDALQQQEAPRIEQLMQRLVLYHWIAAASTIVGIALIIIFYKQPAQTYWKGFGIGLAIMASIALSFDVIAGQRAGKYLKGLQRAGQGTYSK